MQIHEIIHNATFQVILNAIDDDLLAKVHDLQVGILVFITVLVQSDVCLLIFAYAVEKVMRSGLGILTAVVGASRLDVADVRHDDILVIALTFDKQDFDAIFRTDVVDPFATLLGRIGSIEYSDNSSSAEPSEHVGNGSFCCSTTLPLALGIVGVEEVGCGLWRIAAPIVAYVESLRRYRQPLQVALRCDGRIST